MHEVVVALAVVVLTLCVLFVLASLWLRWRMQRLLRIVPTIRSAAPSTWLLSTSEPARLHRRLRRAAASARVAADHGGPAVESLAAEIQAEALRLEAQLVALSRLWRTERDARRHLAAEVAELERLTIRVAGMSGAPALGTGSDDNLRDLRERLDALDAARQELRAVERKQGLGSA